MSTFLWFFAILLAIIASLAGLVSLFYILNIVIKSAASATGFSALLLLQLILSTILDIRFLSLLAIIFTMMGRYEQGGWVWIGFIFSCSLFLMSAAYIVMFLLELIDKDIFMKLETYENLSPEDKKFWDSMVKIIHINIGFLGMVYIFLAFVAVSYSYVLLFYRASGAENIFIFSGQQRFVYLEDFISYACQMILDAIPFDFSKKFSISVTNMTSRSNAYLFNAFVVSFQFLFYSALIEFIWWFAKGKNESRK